MFDHYYTGTQLAESNKEGLGISITVTDDSNCRTTGLLHFETVSSKVNKYFLFDKKKRSI